jgi:uncharacterized repeat protein (TIGR03803 family)
MTIPLFRPLRKGVISILSALALLPMLTASAVKGDVTFTSLYSFTNGPDGSYPAVGLTQGSNGNFYGATEYGGTSHGDQSGGGVIFKMNANGGVTPLYSFTNGSDGSNPFAALTLGGDGNFYGTAFDGVVDEEFGDFWAVEVFPGTIFKLSPCGDFSVLYSFTNGGGAFPVAPLLQTSNGDLYGTTAGYALGSGTAFKITTNGVFTLLYSFTNGVDGSSPEGMFAQGNDGNLYGTASSGGTNGFGAVFRITTNGVLTPLYSFTNGIDGSDPSAGLKLGTDGNFYGTTAGDGKTNYGSMFTIASNGALSVLHSFTNGVDGGAPYPDLVLGSDGNFYGVSGGGPGGNGVLFKITFGGVLTPLYSFTNGIDGSGPNTLLQGSGGNFYGTTTRGGTTNQGTVFRITVSAPSATSFQSITRDESAVALTWNALWGAQYQLQYSDNLSSASWTNLGAISVTTNSSITNIDTTVDFRRFYRVYIPW